jgi:uncharacterized phage protein gp47/JayE
VAIINTKSKEQMLIATLDSLNKNVNISSVSPGSIARAFAEAIHSEISDLYNSLKVSVEQSNLSTASGMNLDMIGSLYNVPRRTISSELVPERTTGNIEFFLNTTNSTTITVPQGTLVYNDTTSFSSTQYQYELSADVVIPAGNTRAYGTVKAKFADNNITASRNTLVKHNYIAPPGVIVYCNNPKEVYSSLNSESDDNYRRRIVSSIRGSSSGTSESIRFAALSVKGVRDAKIREASYGIGSCDIIIIPETQSGISTMSQLVYEKIKAIKPVGINLNLRIATKKLVEVSATLTLREGTTSTISKSVENQARIFLNRYLNSLTIGDSVSVGEIERQMKLASELIVSVAVNNIKVDNRNIPNKDYRLSDDKSYMAAGTLSLFSVIMGVQNY